MDTRCALSVTREWMRSQSANYARNTVMEHSRCIAMNAETKSICSVDLNLNDFFFLIVSVSAFASILNKMGH